MESKNLARGLSLFEMGRNKEAIPFFQKAISENADDWSAKYYLAHCLYDTGDFEQALIMADTLLQETPNHPDVFFLKARIALQQDRDKEARSFIEEAISINPNDPDYLGFKSGLLLHKKNYEEALTVVNEGLRIDPKNSYCLNLRAQILTKLDRVEEADETVENILYDNPEDSYSHANVGWVALENGNHKQALEHFRQALQFDPNFSYAREGMTTALKSKNIFYRWYLKYAFWIGKKSSKNQWVFIIGIYIAYRAAVKLLSATGMTYAAIPLMGAYLLFALGGWIMEPLSNTILNFDRYGKYLLGNAEKTSGYFFGGLLLLGLMSILVFYITDIEFALTLGITFICTLLPLPRSFLLPTKKGRAMAAAYGVGMLATGCIAPFFTSYITAGIIVFGMMVLYTWIGNLIES